jgi:hypothetical protein
MAIKCNLMRVGSWREGSRSPSFVKISLYQNSLVSELRVGELIDRVEERRGEEKELRLCCSPALYTL